MNLAFSKGFFSVWREIFFKEVRLFEVISLNGGRGPYLFVPGDAFIVGRVKERLETDVIGSSFFGIEDSSLFHDDVHDV